MAPPAGGVWETSMHRRGRTVSTVTLAFLLRALAARAGEPGGQAPSPERSSFKAGVDVVALDVTVLDPDRRFITDLQPGDFAVYEDGVQQDLAFFRHDGVPLDLAILIDSSASMSDKLAVVRDAASGFVRTLRPQDRAAVVTFNTEARFAVPFTDDRAALFGAIARIDTGGATALNNALYLALNGFARDPVRRASTQIRRPAIVLLSDGEDTASLVSFEQALDLAKRAGVSVYPISIKTRYATAIARHYVSDADLALRTLALETGGQVSFPERLQDLSIVYSQIASELISQYSLGYTSKNPKRDGAWRNLVVRVLRAGAVPRAKRGYFAPGVGSTSRTTP